MVALRGMILQITQLPDIWKRDIFDGLLWLGTFTGVVLLDVDL